MYDAFISYRRKNGFAAAKMIRELLKAKGITAYMDLDELRNGTFDDKLLDAIRNCPTFILVLPPKALTDCDKPNDWLTKEVKAAVESGRNIIPVFCDGFKWPKKWKQGIPDEIKRLSSLHGVEMSPYYVDAMIDRIIDRIKGDSSPQNAVNDLESFFRNRMRNMDGIQGIDLAFHSGSAWLESTERLDVLEELLQAGIRLRILINSPEAIEPLAIHMRHKRKWYMSFAEAVERWRVFAQDYENAEVRVSEIPLLRIYHSFNMVNEEDGVVRVKYYTYANPTINKNYSQNFEPGDSCYDLYKTEFEFLWEQSHE